MVKRVHHGGQIQHWGDLRSARNALWISIVHTVLMRTVKSCTLVFAVFGMCFNFLLVFISIINCIAIVQMVHKRIPANNIKWSIKRNFTKSKIKCKKNSIIFANMLTMQIGKIFRPRINGVELSRVERLPAKRKPNKNHVQGSFYLVGPSYMVHYGGAYYEINPNPTI